MTFIELARKILEEEKRPLSAEEMWELALKKGYDEWINSKGKTPTATLGAQIYVHMRDRKNSPFIKMDVRPRRFFLNYLPNPQVGDDSSKPDNVKTITSPKKPRYLELNLHPLLAYYAQYYLKAYTRTIQHHKSDKKEFGEWVHPDMVGCYFPIDEWKPEVIEFSATIGNISIKLFSFEIKRALSFSNLRESFFQTVSNSSWANESYLVAAEISADEDFQNELRRLSTSFGIGVIKLDVNEPDSSEVLFPAEYKEYLDWDMINKLTSMNEDFKGFIKRIKIDISSKEVRKEKYDKVLSVEELIRGLNSKTVSTLSFSEQTRVAGLNKDAAWMSEDFDEPLPDEFWTGTE